MGFLGYSMSSEPNNGTSNGGNDGGRSIAEDGGSADSRTQIQAI